MSTTSPAVRRIAAALSVIGALISAYLTYEHHTGSRSLLCSASQSIDCAKVTTSSYASVFGLPVADLGLAFFLAMCVLTIPPAAWKARALDAVRLVAALAGLGFVFYLVWAEFYGVGAICLWCTGVHVTTLVLTLTLLYGFLLREQRS